MIQPYTDSYLSYDEKKNQYILTPKAILDAYGIDLNGEAVDPNNLTAVRAILARVSTIVYAFIHSFNADNVTQDLMIAGTQEGRQMIFDALLEQFIYMRANGDMSLTDRTKAAAPLLQTILELRFFEYEPYKVKYSVLYSGRFPFILKNE